MEIGVWNRIKEERKKKLEIYKVHEAAHANEALQQSVHPLFIF